jgi:hypothetical protein
MDIAGTLHILVYYGAKHLPPFTFYVAKHSAKLLGLDLFTGLEVTER